MIPVIIDPEWADDECAIAWGHSIAAAIMESGDPDAERITEVIVETCGCGCGAPEPLVFSDGSDEAHALVWRAWVVTWPSDESPAPCWPCFRAHTGRVEHGGSCDHDYRTQPWP